MKNPTKIFIPFGGLNKDDDPSTIPDGDYIDANNLSKGINVAGGGNTFKKSDGFSDCDLNYAPAFGWGTSPQVVDMFPDDENRIIYYLVKENTYAWIEAYDIDADDTTVAMPRYAHGGYSEAYGNLQKIGDMLFWNYLTFKGHSGVPCSWYLQRSFTETDIISSALLLMNKPAPNKIEITGFSSSSPTNNFFARYDLEFAYRFVYDSGERSVLSQPYNLFKANGAKQYLRLTIDDQGDSYVTKYELYARKGNNGVWYRITTEDKGTTFYDWFGELNEVLDDEATATPFHFVPFETKAIEVAENVVFLGNNLMDLDPTISGVTIAIDASSSDYEFPTSSPPVVSYFRRNSSGALTVTPPSNAFLNRDDQTGWVMPFADNSVYLIGVAFFDEGMRTPGVSVYGRLVTGAMAYPMMPEVTVTFAGGAVLPDWVKWMGLCVTKNLTMDRFYEGFASDVFFQIESDGITYYSYNATQENSSSVKYMVLDISGLLNAGHIYTYQDGDICRITNYETGAAVQHKFNVVGQDGKYVFLDFDQETMNGMGDDMDAWNFDFIIFSPSESTENIVFYPQYNSLIEVTPGVQSADTFVYNYSGSGVDGHLVGDCVIKTLSISPYLRSSLKSAEINVFEKSSWGQQSDVTNPYTLQIFASSTNLLLSIDTVYENNDGGSIVSDEFALNKTYDTGRVTLSFSVQLELPSATNVEVSFLPALYVDSGGTILTPIKGPKRVMTAASGQTILNIDLFTTVEFAATDLTSSDAIGAYLLLFGSTTIANCILTISNVVVTLEDYENKKVGKEIDFDTPINFETTDVLVRSMNFIDNNSWDRYGGMPLLPVRASDPVRKEAEIRHGGNYVEGLLINNISNFTALNRAEIPFEFGGITALYRASKSQSQGNVMLAFTKHETCSVYIGETQVRDTGDTELLAISSSVIGSINPLNRSFGTSHPKSIQRRSGNVYFWDNLEKKIVRYNRNVLVCLSGQIIEGIDPDTKMISFFNGKAGSPIGVYDPYNEYYIVWFEGDADQRAVVYSEKENRWISFFDYNPEFGSIIDNVLYSLRNDSGTIRLSKSQNSSSFNLFPGAAAQETDITFVFNSPVPIMFENVTIRHNSDVIDYARSNDIKDSLIEIVITNENGQQTTIYEEMLLLEKNMLYSHVLRDENSSNGLIEGDFMEGFDNEILITLRNTRSNEQLAIAAVSFGYFNSYGHKL